MFGRNIQPGQLIHADKHGFLAVTQDEESELLAASLFMDNNECETVIAAARSCAGLSTAEAVQQINAAGAAFGAATQKRFGADGEW